MSTNKDTIMTDQEILHVFQDTIALNAEEYMLKVARTILSRAIPEGHVVVPKVLTQEMSEAMKQSIANPKHTDGILFNFQDDWDAALAAAPANKEG